MDLRPTNVTKHWGVIIKVSLLLHPRELKPMGLVVRLLFNQFSDLFLPISWLNLPKQETPGS